MSEPTPSQVGIEPEPPPLDPEACPAGDSGKDPAASPPPPGAPGSARVSAKIGEVEGDTYVGGEQTFNHYHSYERQERLRLSRGHFEVCESGRLERERERLFWGIAERRETLLTTLESQRFLLLCGEPELGKGSMARLLAATVCSKHRLSEMLYCRQSPPREMEVPIPEIFGESHDYRGRAVVLKDVMARDNADIRRFLQGLDKLQLDAQTEELRRNQSFLIFTTDSERLGGLEAKLQGLGLLQPLSPPATDVLQEALHRLAEPLRQEQATVREALRELLRQKGERIAAELKTLPRAVRFVRESLLDVLSGRISLEQALRRAYDLESWLLRDLPENFDAWCYTLALVLCHAASFGENVTWMHFDRFRQLLSRHLRKELRCFGDKRVALDLCRGEELARLARAEVQRPGYPQPSTVAFSGSSYPARLWKVLLGPGRHLPALLIPFLKELTSAPEFYLRAIAARALGRIGELDPSGTAFPAIQNPGDGSEERRSRLLGQTLQGALSSDDAEYGKACLRQLRRKLRSRDTNDVTLALLSLKDIGELNLALALREMRATADHWLIPRTRDGRRAEEGQTLKGQLRELEQLARTDIRIASILRAAEHGHVLGVLDEIFSKKGLAVLEALQYALVGLCLGREPIASVVSELQSWVEEETSEAGQFLALLFLRPLGVLDVLDHIPMPAPTREDRGSTGSMDCGVVLYELAAIDGSIPSFQAFLETLHDRLCALPSPLRQGLRKRWLGSLKGWARQAYKAEGCRPSLVLLLRRLVRSSKPEVRRDVLSILQGDRDFAPGSDLEAMALEAITGISPS